MKQYRRLILLVAAFGVFMAPLLCNGQCTSRPGNYFGDKFRENPQVADYGNDWRFAFGVGYTNYLNDVKDLPAYGGVVLNVAAGYSWEDQVFENGLYAELRIGASSSMGSPKHLGFSWKSTIHAGRWAITGETGAFWRYISSDDKSLNNLDYLMGAKLRFGKMYLEYANLSAHPFEGKGYTQYTIGITESIFNYH